MIWASSKMGKQVDGFLSWNGNITPGYPFSFSVQNSFVEVALAWGWFESPILTSTLCWARFFIVWVVCCGRVCTMDRRSEDNFWVSVLSLRLTWAPRITLMLLNFPDHCFHPLSHVSSEVATYFDLQNLLVSFYINFSLLATKYFHSINELTLK